MVRGLSIAERPPMKRARVVVAVFAIAAGGCVPRPEDYLAVSKTVASMRLQCPSDAIVLERFAEMTQVARGCGQEAMITCLEPDANGFAGPSGQCFPMQDLRVRAAFELSCEARSLALLPLDRAGHTVGVSGCGRRAVYQYVQVSEDKYNWTLSGSVRAWTRRDPASAEDEPTASPDLD
jgi:hypothetical protein